MVNASVPGSEGGLGMGGMNVGTNEGTVRFDRSARGPAPLASVAGVSEALYQGPPETRLLELEREALQADVSTLYTELAPRLSAVATRKFRIPPEEADALVHEVFVGYLRSHGLVRDPRTWLTGAVCNASRRYLRLQVPVECLSEETALVEDETDRIHCALDVGEVLNRLDARCQEVLRDHYYDGYSAAEMAVRVATTRGYAEQSIHRCLKAARRIARKRWR